MNASAKDERFDDDDLLAAEYVVGAGSAAERAAIAERVDHDQRFAQLVNGWIRRFEPLDAAYPSVDAPSSIKEAIDRRLFPATTSKTRAGLWSNITFWRGLAAAAVTAFVVLAGTTMMRAPTSEPPRAQLVASLSAEGSPVRFLAVYDPRSGAVGLSHVAGDREAGKDFELWMIEGQNAPVSMGVIPVGPASHLAVDETSRAKLAAGALLAISLEPAGGSPTGRPTGPVIAAGDLRNI